MPYLGNELATQFQAFVTQTITGDGSTGYTLDRAVANGKELLVYINNVKQEEGSGKAYTASGTTITFSEAVASGDSCYVVFLGSAVQTVVPPDASIVSSMFANSALTLPNTLDVDAGITVDNLTLDGTTLSLSSGDLTIDSVAGDIVLDAHGHDYILKTATSSELAVFGDNTSGDFFLRAAVQDKDILFMGNDGGSTIEAARFDMSEGGILLIGTTDSNPNDNSADSTADNGIALLPSGLISIATHQNATMVLNRTGNDGSIMDFRISGSTKGVIGTNAGFLQMYTATSGGGGIQHNQNGSIPINNSGTATDDTRDLGQGNFRWRDVYTNGAVTTTSDQNEKQDIESLTAKELKVANKLSALFKTYRWKDRVAEKGEKARTHSGIIAQDIQSAFSAEGLDASDYGMFMSNTWWEKEVKVDAVKADEEKGIEAKDAYTYMDTKDEKTDGYTERTRLGVRYTELFSFIFSSIEARLTALEGK